MLKEGSSMFDAAATTLEAMPSDDAAAATDMSSSSFAA